MVSMAPAIGPVTLRSLAALMRRDIADKTRRSRDSCRISFGSLACKNR